MSDRQLYPALTSARFVAAFVVVVFHLWRWDVWLVPPVVQRLLGGSAVAVTFFFVLSGFVLTLSATDDGGGLSSTKTAFWRARLARVLPVHWLALLLAVPIALALWKKAGALPHTLNDVVTDGLLSLTFLQAWVPGHELAMNPPAWSMAVEAFFYALFPWVAPRLLAATKQTTGLWLAGLWLASWAPGIVYLGLDPDGLAAAGGVADHRAHALYLDVLKYHPLLRLPELLMGVIAAGRYKRGWRLRPVWALVALVVVVVAVAVGVPYPLVHNGLFAPCFVVIVIAMSSLPPTSLWAAGLLQKLGEASYALYALHVPVLWWISGIGQRRTGSKVLEQPLVAGVAGVFVVVVSRLVFVFFERPLRRRLRGSP